MIHNGTDIGLDVWESREDIPIVLPNLLSSLHDLKCKSKGMKAHVVANPNLVTINIANSSAGSGSDPGTSCTAHGVAAGGGSVDGGFLPAPVGNGNAEGWEDLLIFVSSFISEKRKHFQVTFEERKMGNRKDVQQDEGGKQKEWVLVKRDVGKRREK